MRTPDARQAWHLPSRCKAAAPAAMALASLLLAPTSAPAAEDPAAAFSTSLKPLFTKHCIKCHGGEKTKGKVNLKEITTAPQLRSKPKLLKEMIEAIDAYDMPPEDEPELAESERSTLLASLESALREAVAEDAGAKQIRIRRLNRFQYN
ncbi:MAG: hypothetical protein QGG01_05785, partial [Roseibacillus sp.]|nr:hypothetical protein [Roseibacillus sp.]